MNRKNRVNGWVAVACAVVLPFAAAAGDAPRVYTYQVQLDAKGALQSATGIDRLRVLGPDDTVGRGTALAAGQYITKDIYLEVITDARGYTATQLEISLTRALSLLSQAGGSGQSNLSIRYRKDY